MTDSKPTPDELADWCEHGFYHGVTRLKMLEIATELRRLEDANADLHACPDCGESCKGCQCYETREADYKDRIAELEAENHQLRIAANEHELFLRGLESDEEPNELDHSWPHRT